MTQREKIMALCVAGTLGGYGLVTAVRWAVLEPLRAVDKQIAQQRDVQHQLKSSRKALRRVEGDWAGLTGRTLADDPKEAQQRFREDMHLLLAKHGLRDPKMSAGTFQKHKNGFMGVPLNISASGTLKDVVGFLTDFYGSNYLARLDKVSIAADQRVINDVNSPRRRASKGRNPRRNTLQTSGPDGPELRVSISAVTLVLPELKGLDHPLCEEVLREEQGRLPREVAAYTEIFDSNLFQPHKPPEVVVKPPEPDETEEVVEERVEERTVVVDRRAGASQQLLVATIALNGKPQAYVMDKREPLDPPAKYREDDPIDDGVLLLIHPKGLVVRVEEAGGRVKDYFYPLRVYPGPASFADREELDEWAHPDVWRAMEAEFLNWNAGRTDGSAELG